MITDISLGQLRNFEGTKALVIPCKSAMIMIYFWLSKKLTPIDLIFQAGYELLKFGLDVNLDVFFFAEKTHLPHKFDYQVDIFGPICHVLVII
jgi:hypothetical protein